MVDTKAEGANLKDCVITVPAFFNRAQRATIMAAASAAKLNVLNLIHENTAAALYYGAERFDEKKEHFAIFYNLGSSYLQVCLAKYTVAEKQISKLSKKTVEAIEILAHSWDEEIGGRTFDAVLARHILDQFPTAKRNDKNLARLMKNVNKAKQTLSANKEANFVVE
jgi:molecular chaperone DnaK (HSP70)